VLKVS
jgi:hypothetical protein